MCTCMYASDTKFHTNTIRFREPFYRSFIFAIIYVKFFVPPPPLSLSFLVPSRTSLCRLHHICPLLLPHLLEQQVPSLQCHVSLPTATGSKEVICSLCAEPIFYVTIASLKVK